eukprot:768689-Hanusia_phi.AAC.6
MVTAECRGRGSFRPPPPPPPPLLLLFSYEGRGNDAEKAKDLPPFGCVARFLIPLSSPRSK